MDCERDDCLICSTETSRKGTCRRRNVLYETFCITCKNEKEKKELNGEKTHSEIVILEEENQSKNLSIVQIPDGTEEANDTPVFVEVEVKSEERVLEWENQAKNPIKREKEVVNIPNGSSSPSLSSPNIYSSKQDIPTKACPNIYKKGACPPPTPTLLMSIFFRI